MKKIIFTLIMVLFLVGNCYGMDNQLKGDWKSQNEFMDCTLGIIETIDVYMSIECKPKKDDIVYMFNGNNPINNNSFGKDNVIFWELKRNGKQIQVIPKNIDKMTMEWIRYEKGNGEYKGKDHLVNMIVDQISKMTFIK